MTKKADKGKKKASSTRLKQLQASHLTPGKYLDLLDDIAFLEGHWRDRAGCVEAVAAGQIDAMEWFPAHFPGSRDHVPRLVRQICEACPVRIECLVYALSTGEDSGIWAGRSEKELAQVRRKLRSALTAYVKARE